jgi:hypothetical protein
VGRAVIASIHPSFAVDLPQKRGNAVEDVCVVQGEGNDLAVMMLSLGDGTAASAAATHTVEFTRVVEGSGSGWALEQAKATVNLKVSDAWPVTCDV